MAINNVQGTGAAQWVALYYANGDSVWRNVSIRYAAPFHSLNNILKPAQ